MPVNVEGLAETRRALKKFMPDLYLKMNDEIKVALKSVTDEAATHVPQYISGLTNWNATKRDSRTDRARAFPAYNPEVIRRGLKYTIGGSKKSSGGFRAYYQLLNKSAAGAILETAGSVSKYRTSQRSQSNNPQAGAHFQLAINNQIGALKQVDNRNGRLLVAAYANNRIKTINAVLEAIDKATKTFHERARAIGVAA